MSDIDHPIFGPPSLSIAGVPLLKKYLLPVAGVGFSKVSKPFVSLDTFWVLLRAFLCFYDLVAGECRRAWEAFLEGLNRSDERDRASSLLIVYYNNKTL